MKTYECMHSLVNEGQGILSLNDDDDDGDMRH
jgi:hypothetical protein